MAGHGKRALVEPARQRGFTVVELMVTIAILAILVALAVPSFTALMRSNRLTSTANELVAALQLTRSEAVRLNGGVSLCRSADGNACANAAGNWAQFLIVTRDGTVLRASTLRAGLAVRSSVLGGLKDKLTFGADGVARDGTGNPLNMVITVCMPVVNPTSPPDNIRNVAMVGGSRIRVESASDNGTCQGNG
ncbi:Tfp pilus assembly protein FimT/FimU [Xanthomonas sp. GPE 39]|uniref:pilus assembly FimT family protein n=1 Tax=Xanthomonas sp. GPE 39 TaxID=1583099 RepID=UPI0005F2C077|nr:Tfp pilus assembly protein FimT/FimU [Xanthomonas sp. GPE 39]